MKKAQCPSTNDQTAWGAEPLGTSDTGIIGFARRSLLPGALWTLLLASLVGCQTGVYSPSSLPPEFQASRAVNLDSFQLTHLGPGVADNEMIHPGDTLQVKIRAGDETFEDEGGTSRGWDIVVAEDGAIAVPLIGPLRVAGLSLAGASSAIRETGIRREIYRDPTVSVTFKEKAVNRVTVTGAVQKPGTYDLRAGASTLAAALAAAEGLSDEASPIVEIQASATHRPSGFGPDNELGTIRQTSYSSPARDPRLAPAPGLIRLNLMAAQTTGEQATMNRYLQDGTTVTVMKSPERYVTLMGLTGNKILPLPPGRQVRLLDALAESGGPRHSNWIADKVKVIRQRPGSDETITIKASVRAAKRNADENVLLAAGDVVSVEENLVTFTIDTLGSLVGVGFNAARTAATGL